MCKEYKNPEYLLVTQLSVGDENFEDYINAATRADWQVHTIDMERGTALLVREKAKSSAYEKAWMDLPA